MAHPDPPPAAERRRAARSGPAAAALDPLYGLVRWTVGHVRGVYAELGVFLLVGAGAATLSVALFALVTEWMLGGASRAFDEAAVAWGRAHRSPLLDSLAIVGAALGSGAATWIVLLAGSAYLWITRHRLSVLLLWLSLVGGRWLSRTLKDLFDRPRPDAAAWNLEAFGYPIHFPGSPSFPSGHAVTSVVVFGTLAYLIMRLEPTARQRRATLAVAAALILLIGLSRIYLGVHYPTDVLAGFLAGFVWATFSVFAIEVLRYAARRDPAVARQEEDLEKGLPPLAEPLGGEGGG